MNEKPKSIWKKKLTGQTAVLVWAMVAGLVIALAILFVALGNVNQPIADTFGAAALGGVIVIAAVLLVFYGLWPLARWSLWKNWRRTFFAAVCFATLIALFYAEENWRGKRAWENYKQEWEAKGEHFDFKDFVPPTVPGDQNFALTPIWVESMKAQLGPKNSRLWFGDDDVKNGRTNFVNRLEMLLAASYSDWPTNPGSWEKTTLTDLKPWQDYYRNLATKTNLFPVAPQPQSPAADVLLALSKYDSVVEELREAGKLPYSRFPLEYDKDDPAAILLPHLAALKRGSQALQLRAIAELQNGQNEQAFDDVKLSLRLADSVRTEPFIITHLVRIAVLNIALQPVWEGLAEHKWSDAQLAGLDAELSKLDFPADYGFSVRCERAYHGKIIDWIEQKRSRYWELTDMIDQNHQPNTMKNLLAVAVFYLMPKGWFYQNEIVISQLEQQWNLPMADAANQTVSPKKVQQAKTALESSLHPAPFNLFAQLLLPSLGDYAKKIARGQTSANLARVAIALERHRLAHGEFPESLDALAPQFIAAVPHDVIGGQPLKYRREAGGQFIIYSVGWNEKDDGGVMVIPKDSSQPKFEEGDWVWRYPQK